MDRKDINAILTAYNNANETKKEILEILEKGSDIFVLLGTPNTDDSGYIHINTRKKEISQCYIFDFFDSAEEMDKYVIYSKKGG